MTTRTARKLVNDALSAAKCKAQDEAHEAVAAAVTESTLVADQGSMIKIGYTPKNSKMNPTCDTEKPQSVQTPNSLENSSQNVKEPNQFSQSNLATQVGKDEI